jgi:hypothetical protein
MQFYAGTSAKFYIVAVDETDLTTRKTGLFTFTGYISQNGGSATSMLMSVTEVSSTNMAGVYYVSFTMPSLTAGNDFEEAVVHITHAGMAPVSRAITIARPKFTAGSTLSTAAIADSVWDEDITGHVSNTASTGYHLNNIMDVQETQGLTINSIFTYTGTMDTNGLNTPLGVRNAVWNATQSSYTIAGTTGGSLNDASSGGSAPTAAEIADAVWDEAQADHITSGSFGVIANEIAILDNKITIVDNLVDLIFADTNELQQNQGDWATATGFSTLTAQDVADAVWDEQIITGGHTLAGSFGGKIFTDLDAKEDIADSVWNELRTGHTAAGTFGSFLDAAVSSVGGGTPPTAAEIADAVWDEAQADHIGTGTFGIIANEIAVLDNKITIVDNLVDLIFADTHELQQNQGDWATATGFSTHSAADVVSDVWDQPHSSHTTSGTFGAHLLLSTNQNHEVHVTGSNHIAADVHEFQDNSLTADATDATFVAEVGGGGSAPTAAQIYDYFTDLSREDIFKADLTGLPTNASIADAVWDELAAGHTTTGSFGDYLDAEVSGVSGGGGGGSTASQIYDYFTDLSREDVFKADVSGLSTFDPSSDTVANVTTVATVSGDVNTNTASRDASKADITSLPSAAQVADAVWDEAASSHTLAGTFGHSIATLPTSADIADDVWDSSTSSHSISGSFGERVQVVPTKDQIADQVWDETMAHHLIAGSVGEKLNGLTSAGSIPSESDIYSYFTTASRQDTFKASVAGLSTFNPSTDAVVNVTNVANITNPVETDVASRAASKADVSGLATASALTTVDNVVDNIKTKTDQLTFTVAGQVDANALSGGGGDDAATIYSYFTTLSRDDAFKADVSALSTSAEIAGLNDITASDVLSVMVANASTFKADTTGLARIVDTDALDTLIDSVKAKTDQLTFSVAGQVDANALTSVADTSAAEIYTYFTDASREDLFKADVSSLASQASVDGLNDPSVAEITSGLQAVSNDFKADVSGLATSAEVAGLNDVTAAEVVTAWGNQPQNVFVTAGTLGYYLDGRISELSAAGSGLYQLTVTVTDDSAVPLQGARVNIDGTNLTLTTPSNGTVVFNLDNGSYAVSCSPPAGYDTPANESATIIDADTNASFALTPTNPPSGGGDVDWVG